MTAPYQALSRSKPALKRAPALCRGRRQPPAEGSAAFGRSSSAASAGERVSDSSSEMIVADQMVTANWR